MNSYGKSSLKRLLDDFVFTGWERTGHMLCIADTSLSVLMTLRVCLRELCCLFILLFGFKPLGKGVLLMFS